MAGMKNIHILETAKIFDACPVSFLMLCFARRCWRKIPMQFGECGDSPQIPIRQFLRRRKISKHLEPYNFQTFYMKQ